MRNLLATASLRSDVRNTRRHCFRGYVEKHFVLKQIWVIKQRLVRNPTSGKSISGKNKSVDTRITSEKGIPTKNSCFRKKKQHRCIFPEQILIYLRVIVAQTNIFFGILGPIRT